MLFGMTARNSASARALWGLWDAFHIEESELVGWWEEGTVATVAQPACGRAPPTPPSPPTPPGRWELVGRHAVFTDQECPNVLSRGVPNVSLAECEQRCLESMAEVC
jgi:hypothetical protein